MAERNTERLCTSVETIDSNFTEANTMLTNAGKYMSKADMHIVELRAVIEQHSNYFVFAVKSKVLAHLCWNHVTYKMNW